MFMEEDVNVPVYETENYSFALIPNQEDDFRHFLYVNGLYMPKGGTIIKVITDTLIDDKLSFRDNSDLIYKQIAATFVPLAKAEMFWC